VFSSPTCGPCQTIRPTIEDLKEEFSSLRWVHVNIQDDPSGLTKKYGVMKVPTIVVDAQKGIESHSGTTVTGYYRILRNALSN